MPVAEQGQPESAVRRGARWLHHHPNWWFVSAVTLDTGYGLLRNSLDIGAVMAFAVLVLLIASLFASAVHRFGVCDRCIAEVPLDGAEEALTHRWPLTWFHRIYDRHVHVLHSVISIWPMAFWVGWLGLVTIAPTRNFFVYEAVELVFWVWILVTWKVEHQHNRLYPWCPQCHDSGWDGREETPQVPDPVPSGEKQNVL